MKRALLLLSLVLSACSSGATLAPSPTPLTVTVYQDVNFLGQSETLKPGKYATSRGDLGNVGDKALSSLRIPAGLFVRLCEGDDSSAQVRPCLGLSGDAATLHQFWNDRTSSLEIGTDPAVLENPAIAGNWVLRVSAEEAYTFEIKYNPGLLRLNVRQFVYGPNLSNQVFSGAGQVSGDLMTLAKGDGHTDRWAFLSDTKARVEYSTAAGVVTLEANRE